MKRFLLLTVALIMLIFTCANAQLIGEGDTLWFKTGLPTITQVQFSPDGTKLGVYGEGIFILYNSENGEELWRNKFPFFTNNFQFSIDGSLVYIFTPSEKTIFGYKIQTGEIIETNSYDEVLKTTYWNLWLTSNPNIFLLSNPTGCVAIYDKLQKKVIKEKLSNEGSKIFACPYSDYFIKAYQYESSNKWKTKIEMYDINTLDFVATLGEEEALVETGGDIKISYNGKYAATNFGGRALQIWDLENKKLFKEYTPTIPTDSTSGRGGGPSLAFCHNNEMLINCGGRYSSVTSKATTLTNFINDKRALLHPDNDYITIDVNNLDTKLAGGSSGNIVVLKLRKDAVPVKDTSNDKNEIFYPNPTTGNITINIPQKFGFINSGNIFDNTGRIVKSLLPNELITSDFKLTINLYGLQTGTYILKLNSVQDILSYKIILER